MVERTRVAVVGVGTMGSMSAWSLALAGVDVVGFERYGIPHDLGGHGAETRIYRQAYREGAMYIPLLKRSHKLWKRLTAESGRPVFTENGCLYISDGQRPWLQQTAEAAAAADIPFELLSDRELAFRYPQHRLYGGETALMDLHGGTLRPEQAVMAAAHQATRLGAVLNEWTTVTAIEPDDDGVTVHCARSADCATDQHPSPDHVCSERFDAAVITTGAWTGALQAEHGLSVFARRLPGTWYAPEDPRSFEPFRFPVCIRSTEGIDYSGFPCVDGWSVKIMPPVFPGTETVAEKVDRAIHPADTAYTRRVVSELLHGILPKPVRGGVYLDGFLDRDEPVIDYAATSRRIVGALGFAGHGFKMSPAVGELVRDLVLQGLDPGFVPNLEQPADALSAEPFRRTPLPTNTSSKEESI